MKLIVISNSSKLAMVDDEDFSVVSRFKWHLVAKNYVGTDLNRACIYLHRLVSGSLSNGGIIDHKDGDTLNNQKSNLRLCPRGGLNMANKPPVSGRKYKGVFPIANAGKKKWFSATCVNGKQTYLGSFETEEAAALAYNDASIKYFGEFGWQNNIDQFKEKLT